jgi:hypothetical protein
MSIIIERNALQTLLMGLLSCQCPVTEKVELELATEFRASGDNNVLDLTPYLAIADRNPEKTPLHIFMTFCSFSQPDPHNFTITHDDAVRYFSSRFHFDRVLSSVDPLVIHRPADHLVSHMLLPVVLDSGSFTGEAFFGEKSVRFENVFLPPEIALGPDGWMGLHLGMAITAMSDEQADMARAHLSLIEEMADLAARTDRIDYKNYQGFGDYRAHIMARYERSLA